MTGRPRNSVDRFWKKVDRRGPDDCWPWMGSTKNGYGRYTEGWADIYAHRYAFKASGGELPEGGWVLHRCNNKRCCNPAHLKPGTPQENTIEAFRDGLIQPARGTDHPQAKLTEEQVREIRRDPRPLSAIAKAHGIGVMTASKIRSGKAWRHVQ